MPSSGMVSPSALEMELLSESESKEDNVSPKTISLRKPTVEKGLVPAFADAESFD